MPTEVVAHHSNKRPVGEQTQISTKYLAPLIVKMGKKEPLSRADFNRLITDQIRGIPRCTPSGTRSHRRNPATDRPSGRRGRTRHILMAGLSRTCVHGCGLSVGLQNRLPMYPRVGPGFVGLRSAQNGVVPVGNSRYLQAMGSARNLNVMAWTAIRLQLCSCSRGRDSIAAHSGDPHAYSCFVRRAPFHRRWHRRQPRLHRL